jgi:hypothetical protein
MLLRYQTRIFVQHIESKPGMKENQNNGIEDMTSGGRAITIREFCSLREVVRSRVGCRCLYRLDRTGSGWPC